jgi:hypothetical protein
VLVGGVSQLFQGDLDLGRVAVERLLVEPPRGPDVLVEDLHYGAIAVVHRLQELSPEALVLVGAEPRGRPPGTVERRRIGELDLDPADVQVAVGDAGTGYVTLGLLVEVAWGFGVLPARTVAIEVEPASIEPGPDLSACAAAALEEALDAVRREVGRMPVLGLADDIRATLADDHLDPSPAGAAVVDLLDALHVLDQDGRWGRTFAERDRLELCIAAGDTGEGMTHVDWALWWTLIEELDRLQAAEVGQVNS